MNDRSPSPLAYSPREAARMLSISEGYLGKLKAGGEISFSQAGRLVLYSHQDLLDWLNKHRVTAAAGNNET